MASRRKRLPGNAAGEFFVDASCIDCGTCQWMHPSVFDELDGRARVHRQPTTPADIRRSLMAALACPTGSIGTMTRQSGTKDVESAFPSPLDGEVFHCGYHSPRSFGATSYLIRRPSGNVLVDSPRFTLPLVRRLEELGGVDIMVLTHRDDVADHQRFRDHFGCDRVMHGDDLDRTTVGVERVVTGREATPLAADLYIIPVPGHTRGSICLLHRDTHLFTGDHLAWDARRDRPLAFRDACWYDWGELVASMRRLAAWRFCWILPGHGWPGHAPAERMAALMATFIADLEDNAGQAA